MEGWEDLLWVSYNLKLSKSVILCMNNPEIFTSEEWDKNEEQKSELIELVASGEAVLIVGAGSSARVGYVTWDGLLEELENLANRCGEGLDQSRKGDPLAYAQDIKSHISNKTDISRYHNLLYNLFRRKSPPCDDFHKMLVSLPFRGILTTNYDTVLEAALGEIEHESASDNSLVIDEGSAARVHEFLMAMNNDKRMTQRIAHLHGTFNPAASIILSIEDYERAYGLSLADEGNQQTNESKLRFRLLWAVLATRRVVFLGFSMDDPYLNKILETVSENLWTWNKSTHFAIMSISSEDAEDSKDKSERLNNEYGVGTVFYEILENEVPERKHKLLESLFDDIVKQCDNRRISVGEAQDLPGDRDHSEGEESESIESGSRDILDWLKRESQRIIRRIGDED